MACQILHRLRINTFVNQIGDVGAVSYTHLGRAVADVLVQLLGLILRCDANGIDVGVDAVGQREVHDTVFALSLIHISPYEQAKGTDWYKGTANAIYQNISFIDNYDPEYVIILSGDQILSLIHI